MGIDHPYEPDFLVRLANGVTVVLEIKGFEDDQDKAKHTAAKRWVAAVNKWGELGVGLPRLPESATARQGNGVSESLVLELCGPATSLSFPMASLSLSPRSSAVIAIRFSWSKAASPGVPPA